MRVIAGTARRLPLKTIEGLDTRPTTDRIKETLFNILQDEIAGIRFLDLCAGSGGIGIEALSRGAAYACFVDQSRACVRCIQENLCFTHLEDRARVLSQDVLSALRTMSGEKPFQIIFMDPPYAAGLERTVLSYLSSGRPSFLTEETLLIIEAALNTDFSWAEQMGYTILREKIYKTNKHVFLCLKPAGTE